MTAWQYLKNKLIISSYFDIEIWILLLYADNTRSRTSDPVLSLKVDCGDEGNGRI